MSSHVRTLVIIRYYKGGRPWDDEVVAEPSWVVVESAVREMDNDLLPIVLLSCRACASGKEAFEDEEAFNVVGGNGRYALFEMMGQWQYVDPAGSTAEARLWESDQGYFCQERNVLADIERVLRIVRAFYDSGKYDELDAVQ